MKKLIRTLIATAVLTTSLGIFALPAKAAVTPVTVFQRCGGSCESEVQSGDAVQKDVRIEVRSSGTQNQWVEIQLRRGSGDWMCIKRYPNNPPSFISYIWSTSAIPNGGSNSCEGPAPDGAASWGARTANDEFGIRVQFQERSSVGSGRRDQTTEFRVKLNNAPDAPTLSSAMTRGNGTKHAYVELRWPRVSDPEIVQYEVIRHGPDGRTAWFVDAANPGRDDCPSSSSSSYVCRDKSSAFQREGFEATYHYELRSFRTTQATSSSSGVTRCARGSSGYCVGSQTSNSKSTTVAGPPEPSPEPQPSSPTSSGGSGGANSPSSTPSTSGPSPSATKTAEQLRRERELARVLAEQRRQDYLDFFTGEYDDTLPFDANSGMLGGGGPVYGGETSDGPTQQASGPQFPAGSRDPAPYRAAAGGSLMLLVAAHMARLLKRSQQRV